MSDKQATAPKIPEKLQELINSSAKLKQDLIRYANNPKGKKTLTLSTGEKALDADDAYLIIGQENNEPYLRSKKHQLALNESPGREPDKPLKSELLSSWETEEIIRTLLDINKHRRF